MKSEKKKTVTQHCRNYNCI